MEKDVETLINTNEYVPKWKYDELLGKYKHLEFQLVELKRLIFGSKSECFIGMPPNQLGLFTEEAAEENSTELQQISFSRQTKRRIILFIYHWLHICQELKKSLNHKVL